MHQMIYPSAEDIIVMNKKMLMDIKVKKADAHKVLSKSKIKNVLELVHATKGDVFDKAVVMLKGLVQAHPFASGNRRTAYASALNFIELNGKSAKSDKGEQTNVLQGIREGYYKDNEIRDWLEKGEIREFKRK